MSFDQAAIVALLVSMLVLFALDRIRMEVVALGGLSLGLALGLVPATSAFAGFSNPAFVTVVEILLIVPVLGRTGLLDRLSAGLASARMGETGTIAMLCAITATVSVFMNNIGALALMIPVVVSVAGTGGLDQRRMLMPVSFAALLGGLCSVIGTPANLLVSEQLARETGHGFAFFDFAYAGVPTVLAGIAAILFWVRPRLPMSKSGSHPSPADQMPRQVVTELSLPAGSRLAGMPAADFPCPIHALRRDGRNLFFQRPQTRLAEGDILLVQIEVVLLESWLAEGKVAMVSAQGPDRAQAVVMPESTVVGSRIGMLQTIAARGIAVSAVASRNQRIEGSLDDVQLGIGDILYLEGEQAAIDDAVDEAELLLVRPRDAAVSVRAQLFPVIVFMVGVLLSAVGLVPPQLAFGLVVLVLAASGALNLRQGLAALDWPILIMLAAMIPLGQAVETTGTAATIAVQLVSVLPAEPLPLVAAMLVLAIAITPFVNNASTAIILGPIAIGIANSAGLPPEPFLIAVALGASIDFLTPTGHHNNMVVMGLAGYRFQDFLKTGWPVTLACAASGILAVYASWL